VERLRDVGIERLPEVEALPPLLSRRARHVITENARVLEARTALLEGDLAEFGRLLYEVSIEPVDLLVALADAHPGVFGARMTGGGFGGAVVIAAAAGTGGDVADHVSEEYAHRSGRAPQVLIPRPA
jgi:galactokinase